eukprot:m.329947 g.329947  ORF g.329947 m.329947 type:complete len:881 (-) comp20454_c0_seq2:450-3092(-)
MSSANRLSNFHNHRQQCDHLRMQSYGAPVSMSMPFFRHTPGDVAGHSAMHIPGASRPPLWNHHRPYQQSIAISPSLSSAVDDACRRIMEDIITAEEYCIFSDVLRRICTEFHVSSLGDLGIATMQVPALKELFDLQQALDNFILAFASTRGIATIRDMESEAFRMLKNMQFPPLKTNSCGVSAEHGRPKKNPDEIEIDPSDSDSESNEAPASAPLDSRNMFDPKRITRFSDYGLGRLQNHPLVQQLWNLPPRFNISCSPSFMEVSEHLPEFLYMRAGDSKHNRGSTAAAYQLSSGKVNGDPDSSVVSVQDLAQFLCQRYNVQHLCQIGILIVEQALPTLVHAFRRVEHATYNVNIKAQKAALKKIVNFDADLADEKSDRLSASRTTSEAFSGQTRVPALKASSNPLVAQTVEACQQMIDSVWSPSYTKVRAAVQTLHQRHQRASSKCANGGGSSASSSVADSAPRTNVPVSGRKTKRRRTHGVRNGNLSTTSHLEPDKSGGNDDEQDNTHAGVSLDALLATTAEYIMFHIGGSKWRRRKFETATNSTAAADSHCAPDDASNRSNSDDDDSDDSDSDNSDSDGSDHISQEDSSDNSTRLTERMGSCGATAADGTRRKVADADEMGGERSTPGALTDGSAPGPSVLEAAVDVVPGSTPATLTVARIGGNDRAPLVQTSEASEAGSVASATPNPRPQTTVAVAVHDAAAVTAPVSMAWRNWKRSDARSGRASLPIAGRALSECMPWRHTIDWYAPLDASNTHAIGRWGEALVYQFLQSYATDCVVSWVNETAETKAPYDITVTSRSGEWSSTRFIEVKTTRHANHNVFDLSPFEYNFATKSPPVNYDVYRVYNAGSVEGPRISIVENLARQVTEGSVRLCLAV